MTAIVDPRITWVVADMQRRLAEPIDVGELAATVNLSPSRFRQLFTRQVGVAPSRYLQRLRLGRARVLIERTFLTVKEVMALVGYNDPSHFSRDFRRCYGISPKALRGVGITTPLPRSPGSSVNRPTHRRIGPLVVAVPRARCA